MVRLHTSTGGSGASVVSHIWRKEEPLAFYKGTMVPLVGVGVCVSESLIILGSPDIYSLSFC